jgi:catechol 2,3-dioxygenase-like lactoylglutathione lyase family enzyme
MRPEVAMGDPLERLSAPVVPIEPRPEFAAALLRQIQGTEDVAASDTATVRYFVNDLDAAVGFYCELLGFEEELRSSPVFAMLYRGDLRLLLSVPAGSHVLPDGTVPQPGGFNRISLRVEDINATVGTLRRQGTRFRTDIVAGVSVDTILLEDPAGNPVELFEPRAGYHERAAAGRGAPRRPEPSTRGEERK